MSDRTWTREELTAMDRAEQARHEITGDDGERELLCEHNVGHSYEVHTCDGCCWSAAFSLRLIKRFGLQRAEDD